MAPGAEDRPTPPRQLRTVQIQVVAAPRPHELVRFENFWETDLEGNSLPYLDALIGRPKKEDRVRSPPCVRVSSI